MALSEVPSATSGSWRSTTRDRAGQVSEWFHVQARGSRGYPQPEHNLEYRRIVYAEPCPRCGIFARQITPFRFKKSGNAPLGFTQLGWVFDAFFASPAILEEIAKAGITGVSAGAAVYHRTGAERADLVQVLIPKLIACAETSRLPPVTCRPENEEAIALRATFAKLPERQISSELQEKIRKQREKIAALPYCGRVKYHPPTSLALIPDHLKGAPDLFQTAEWFGSGGLAFRLTLASERFVKLVREKRWKGLVFHGASQTGWSERRF